MLDCLQNVLHAHPHPPADKETGNTRTTTKKIFDPGEERGECKPGEAGRFTSSWTSPKQGQRHHESCRWANPSAIFSQ